MYSETCLQFQNVHFANYENKVVVSKLCNGANRYVLSCSSIYLVITTQVTQRDTYAYLERVRQ